MEDLPEIHNDELSINLDKKIKKAYFFNLKKKLSLKKIIYSI